LTHDGGVQIMTFIHRTDQPIVEAWVLPPGNLLVTAVTEGGETCITLAATVPGCVTGPGEALVQLVHELHLAKLHLAAERGAR
jgi:hypothetical protein